MPPDVQDPPSTYNIHRRKHEPMEDQHDTSPQGRSSRDRTNKNQERDIPGCSVPKEAEKYLTEAGTTDDMTNVHGKTATWKAKQLKLKYKEDFKKMVRDKWKEKAMHGKFPNYLDKDHVDVELSFKWMKHTGLKGETEGLITAAQD